MPRSPLHCTKSLLALCLAACAGADELQSPRRDPLAQVEVSATVVQPLEIGDTLRFDIVLRDSSGSELPRVGRSITWSVTDSVATIDAEGILVARAVGDGTVTARVRTSAGTRDGTATFGVRPTAAALVIYGPGIMRIGDTARAVLDLRDADSVVIDPATRDVAWSIAPTTIASVDSSGKITALALGNAELRARVDALEATFALTVESLPPTTPPTTPPTSPPTSPPPTLPPLGPPYYLQVRAPTPLQIGDSVRAHAILSAYGMEMMWLDSLAAWESSAPAVVSVSQSGRLTARAAGTARITAYHRGLQGSVDVRVLNTPSSWADLLDVAIGEFGTCGVQRLDGSLLCWGEGGPYGSPYGNTRSPMVVLAGETGFVSTPGPRCGLKADGALRCFFGSQWEGPAAPRWRRLVLDPMYLILGSCGLLVDSTATCWYGGDSLIAQASGTRFLDLDMKRESSGAYAVNLCGVRTDSTAVCWVRGASTMTVVPELTRLVEVRMGSDHACYRDGDGAVWCRGANDRGQLGDGTTLPRASTHRVTGLPPIVGLASRGSETCARAADGRVWCWGRNVATPTLLAFSSDYTTLTIGPTHTCAVKSDGSAWCWGDNYIGQLGDGTQIRRSTPTRVVSSYPP